MQLSLIVLHYLNNLAEVCALIIAPLGCAIIFCTAQRAGVRVGERLFSCVCFSFWETSFSSIISVRGKFYIYYLRWWRAVKQILEVQKRVGFGFKMPQEWKGFVWTHANKRAVLHSTEAAMCGSLPSPSSVRNTRSFNLRRWNTLSPGHYKETHWATDT